MRHLLNQNIPSTQRPNSEREDCDEASRPHAAKRNARHSALMRALPPAVVLLAILDVAACDVQQSPNLTPGAATMTSQQAAAPADLTLTYDYRAGSMPPPYHDEYTVTIGPGPGVQVVYRPDYPSDTTPTWTASFTLTVAELDDLYAFLSTHNLLRTNWHTTLSPAVGGSVRWATYTANDITYSIPKDLDLTETQDPNALYIYVTDELVPQSIWISFATQRTEYQQDYTKTYNGP
jgi:hypothetical protein